MCVCACAHAHVCVCARARVCVCVCVHLTSSKCQISTPSFLVSTFTRLASNLCLSHQIKPQTYWLTDRTNLPGNTEEHYLLTHLTALEGVIISQNLPVENVCLFWHDMVLPESQKVEGFGSKGDTFTHVFSCLEWEIYSKAEIDDLLRSVFEEKHITHHFLWPLQAYFHPPLSFCLKFNDDLV